MKILTLGVSFLLSENFTDCASAITNQVSNFQRFIKRDFYQYVEIIYSLQTGSLEVFQYFESLIKKDYLEICTSLYYSGTHGVAISRNTVIKYANAEYIWFLDIDCHFVYSIDPLLDLLPSYNRPFLYLATENIIRNNTSKLLGDMPKNLQRISMSSFLDHLKIIANAATYNIVISSKYLALRPEIRFCQCLGLGTYYHQSDEALFLVLIFKSMIKSKICSYVSFPMVSLFAESKSHLVSGSALYASLESKGYVLASSSSFIFITLPFLPILSLIFAIKLRHTLGLVVSIKCVVNGYFQGIVTK